MRLMIWVLNVGHVVSLYTYRCPSVCLLVSVSGAGVSIAVAWPRWNRHYVCPSLPLMAARVPQGAPLDVP